MTQAGSGSTSAATPAEGEAGEHSSRIEKTLSGFDRDPSHLIPVLQAIQGRIGYLPPETFELVGRHFGFPASRVYGVATFYAQFYLSRQGEHRIKVCQGTACHVRGSGTIMGAIQKRLGVGPGQTTSDYRFTLERVACFGSCALAPVVVLDGKVLGRMTPDKALKAIENLT